MATKSMVLNTIRTEERKQQVAEINANLKMNLDSSLVDGKLEEARGTFEDPSKENTYLGTWVYLHGRIGLENSSINAPINEMYKYFSEAISEIISPI